ncbi:MAG: hypothetical protein II823_05250 [Kiritimatiellae bacterium]|nr:hypothetical protein [Kiritimatiellia bacterium]
MAWNGSDGAAKPQKSVKRAKPSAWRGLLAAIIVIVGAVGAYLMFLAPATGGGAREKVKAKPTKIAEVAPDLSASNVAIVTEAVEPQKKRTPFYWEQPTTNGLNEAQLRKWRNMHLPAPSFTNTAMHARPPSEYEIFGTRAENEIAMFMTMVPGEGLVGSPDYDESFKDEFLKSCETPIIIYEDDTEYEKQLKREMEELKIDLRQRMRDGEDICEIMAETREEMMRLGVVRQQIESEMRDMLSESESADDFDDCIEAANRILESQGIAPLRINPIVRRNIMRQLEIEEQ